jgi:hypothetical protein
VALPVEPELASALSENYEIRTEPARPGRQRRYVATARRAEVRPHTLVTADLIELLAALQDRPGKQPSDLSPAAPSDVRSGTLARP